MSRLVGNKATSFAEVVKMLDKLGIRTNADIRIQAFLTSHPKEEYFQSEIAQSIGLSDTATKRALDSLVEKGIVASKKRGKSKFFKIADLDVAEADLTEIDRLLRFLTGKE